METSILKTIKKLLGITDEYEEFDQDVLVHINTVFDTLNDLGVGPPGGYSINNKEQSWDEFTEDQILMNTVKSYMYLKVRLAFDPTDSSYARDSFENQAKELEWRLNARAEGAYAGDATG